MTFPKTMAALGIALATIAGAHAETLPQRDGPRPETTNSVPHVQLRLESKETLKRELLRRVSELPGVNLGATRVSLPGATGFRLQADLALARPDVIVGGREFAHMHADGSLHASLHPEKAKAAISAGWAVSHPWSQQRKGWEGFVMIYSPTSLAELEVVVSLIRGSYTFVTGRSLR